MEANELSEARTYLERVNLPPNGGYLFHGVQLAELDKDELVKVYHLLYSEREAPREPALRRPRLRRLTDSERRLIVWGAWFVGMNLVMAVALILLV
jgi:hypothetical protein